MGSRFSISLEKLGNGFRFLRRFRAIKCSTSKNGFTEFAQRPRDIGFVGDEMRPTRSAHEIDVIARTGSCNKKIMVSETRTATRDIADFDFRVDAGIRFGENEGTRGARAIFVIRGARHEAQDFL